MRIQTDSSLHRPLVSMAITTSLQRQYRARPGYCVSLCRLVLTRLRCHCPLVKAGPVLNSTAHPISVTFTPDWIPEKHGRSCERSSICLASLALTLKLITEERVLIETSACFMKQCAPHIFRWESPASSPTRLRMQAARCRRQTSKRAPQPQHTDSATCRSNLSRTTVLNKYGGISNPG